MMSKRVLVILGHPGTHSFCSALADSYIAAAKDASHDVRVMRLGDLRFDPVLREGYQQVQALEPDLLQAQANIHWAEHLVLVYPIWWGGIPALLKGFSTASCCPVLPFNTVRARPSLQNC
jgi:Putative NADPH-quinone reductase (modulator of drug activity B)